MNTSLQIHPRPRFGQALEFAGIALAAGPRRRRRARRWLAALVLLLALPAWGEIEFGEASNFREIRVDPPLNQFQGEDLFILAIDVIDSDTGEVPAGAIVRARNTVSGEQFVLRRSGTEYYELLDYSAERAAGDWIVEVDSDVGDASALIPAFGTGPGTGPIPVVENLAVQPGAQPTFVWTLPTDLASQNDGNVDRLRARIVDSNDNWLVDDRFDNSASATSYSPPPGTVDHNGAFVGQIMIEGFNPFSRSRRFIAFAIDDAAVGGQAVDLLDAYLFRDFRGPNSIGWTAGDRLVVGGEASPVDDTYLHAEQDQKVLPLRNASDLPGEFATSIPYRAEHVGSWDIIAWNGAQSDTAQTTSLATVERLPLVRNIRIVPDNLTPEIRWDLPAGAAVPYDRVQIGLFDDVTDFRLARFGDNQDQLFENLPVDADSYRFEPGVLEQNGRYVVRVLLTDNDNGVTINRSLTFFNFTPIPQSGGGEVFLPSLDEGGIYQFDFDVLEAVPVTIDPEVAIGYRYAIGAGDPRFASVTLPDVGDGQYQLSLYDTAGESILQTGLAASTMFDFTAIDANGIVAFEVGGIETSAGLDPLDTTAFMTTLTFAGSGRFTGSMTPIVVEVDLQTQVACDVNGDQRVDIRDIRAIAARRGQPANGNDDPADWDGNGLIDLLDVRGCQSACTLSRCAIP